MQKAAVPDLDLASLCARVDAGSYARGVQYAISGAVAHYSWEPSLFALQGRVRGSQRGYYDTLAYFRHPFGDGPPEFDHGVCSCPMEVDCKHVVAIVVAATSARKAAADPAQRVALEARRQAGRPEQQPPAQARLPERPTWEATLGALLESGPAATASPAPDVPLAIELTFAPPALTAATRWQPATRQPATLQARLVQPGHNGAWVAGSLRWSRLDSLRYVGHYPAAAVQVLQDIHALYRSGLSHSGAVYYGYTDEKTIDLLSFESQQLWPLLDQACAAGVRLLRGRRLGEIERYGQADLCLDITHAPSASTVTAVLRLTGAGDDTTAGWKPLAFIGTSGHGVLFAPDAGRADDGALCRFQLARLARPAPPQLQAMALAGQQLNIPGGELARFRDDYYPSLRHAATLTSSDGSFEPPVISGPSLVLLASYLPGHHAELSWEWAYQVGDVQRRCPVADDGAGAGDYRDRAAEQNLLDELDLPLEAHELLAARQPRALRSPAVLTGIDTMRFSTELLPLLRAEPGLAIEVTGEPADYHEASDSLRIGVAAGELPGDTDWFDLRITVSVDDREVPFAELFVALSRGQSHLLLPDGAYFSLDKPEFARLARLIEEARALQDAPFGELRVSRFQASFWDELTDLGIVTHQAAAWQDQISRLLSVSAIDRPAMPAMLSARLRPYQLDGFGWLAFLWRHGLGGILADDMGLGKTLQSLALICHAVEAAGAAGTAAPPFLIVAPTSVVANWAAEARRFAPGLHVVPVTETGSRSGEPLGALIAGADAVVTSYALLRLDFDAYSARQWSGLILDEAQFTKNHQSKIYQCARRLPAQFKLAITGTPMENNLMELWALLSITAPGLFPSPSRFSDYYARPIEKGGNAELLAQLRRRIKPLVKRRTKEQVATDLPAKQEQVLEVDLHPRHRKIYQTHLQRERQKVLGLVSDMNANRFTIFRSLTLLRQLSLHAGLVDAAAGDIASAKIDTLVEHLGDVIGSGHRALVFSQFTGFLGKVRERLDAEGIGYSYLDGSTRDRPAAIGLFKSGVVPVFLISLKAGGFGLNLTEADYCFLLDPWWNPATEAQAVDRTHRIGQTRNVMVYRLIARDTIEEKVMALKARKAQLFTSVLDEGNMFGAGLDADDIRGLFDAQ
jgi:SNF2-related domain/Helicase conserved C-terminal domain